MHGYLSRDGQPPRDLLSAGCSEVAGYGGELITGTVSAVSGTAASGFEVLLEDGDRLTARRLVVATGLRDGLPNVPGLRARWGRDVLHCPYCHGYEVRDQPLGVLGGSAESVAHALLVAQWSADVMYFPHASDLREVQVEQLVARGVGVVDGLVTRVVVEDDELRGLELAGGSVVERVAVFVRPRFLPNGDLLVGLGCAGNVANPRAQVITAAGEGSAAAIALNTDLVDEDVAQQVRRHRLGGGPLEGGA
jgi:thioredoxin reductase